MCVLFFYQVAINGLKTAANSSVQKWIHSCVTMGGNDWFIKVGWIGFLEVLYSTEVYGGNCSVLGPTTLQFLKFPQGQHLSNLLGHDSSMCASQKTMPQCGFQLPGFSPCQIYDLCAMKAVMCFRWSKPKIYVNLSVYYVNDIYAHTALDFCTFHLHASEGYSKSSTTIRQNTTLTLKLAVGLLLTLQYMYK